MGLIEEIESFRRLWPKTSRTTKIFLLFSTFLALSPMVSLSDYIVKWKGFISDGLIFYRNNVSKPLIDYASNFNLVYDEPTMDHLMLIVLIYSGIIRSHLAVAQISEPKTKKRYRNIAITLMVLIPGYAVIVGRNPISNVLLGPAVILILAQVPIFFGKYTQKKHIEITMFWIPILSAIALFLVLAAINSGLSTPLP